MARFCPWLSGSSLHNRVGGPNCLMGAIFARLFARNWTDLVPLPDVENEVLRLSRLEANLVQGSALRVEVSGSGV